LDELMRQRTGSGDDRAAGDATLTMRAIVLFDPLAPMCWRGLALWPDALGPLIAAADGEREATLLEEIIAAEATLQWVTMRGKDDIGLARQDARQNRTLLKQPGWSGGLPRLRYVLNPLLPCASRLLDGALATRLPDLLAALESCSAAERDGQRPIDAEIGAMIAARHEDTVDTEILAITHGKDARVAIMAMLRLFSEMQARFAPDVRLPRLAAWLAREAAPLVESWRNPERRARLAKTLATVSEHGSLPSLLALLDNDDARAADERAAAAAANAVRAIDTELRQIAEQSAQRAILAKHLGTEFASAIAAVALVVVFFTLVLF
jgi:hypothetical protein